MKLSKTIPFEINSLHLNNLKNAPLLFLNIKNNINTEIPISNELKIYVKKSLDSSEEKIVQFNLKNNLKRKGEVSDEFIIESTIKENKPFMKCYVLRNIENDTILENPIVEEYNYQEIPLYSLNNYLSTNYKNASIRVSYPEKKDNIENQIKILNENATEENEINIDAHKITMDCFQSKNNTFSLDAEGTLAVKKIMSEESIEANIDFSAIYPVGAIYLSTNDINPSNFFGGIWEQIKERFLLGAGETHLGGQEDGEETHILTQQEIPYFDGNVSFHGSGSSTNLQESSGIFHSNHRREQYRSGGNSLNGAESYDSFSIVFGGNQTHNNMPPYLVVYMWKRIS